MARQRVQAPSGELGWYKPDEFGIRMDSDPGVLLVAYFCSWSKEDQEDFGFPAEGWFTAYGPWVEVDPASVPKDRVTSRLERMAQGAFG